MNLVPKNFLANLMVSIILLFSVSGIGMAAEEIDRLIVSSNELYLEIGDSKSLTATAVYSNGKTENVTIKTDWTSGSPSVASVYAGTVTAKSEGTAVLTSTYMGKTVIINVNVNKKVKALTKDKYSLDLRSKESEQIQLTAVYLDGTTENVTKQAEWSIDNYAIATVTNGLVVGQSSGNAIVTAKFSNQTASIPVSVEIVKRLDPSKSEISLLLGDSEKVEILATYPDGTVENVADKAVWSTDKENVADALKGVITAYGAGKAIITVEYGTKTTAIEVDVDSTRKLDVNKRELFLRANESEQLKLTATYFDGTTEDITSKAKWSSSDDKIASVYRGKIDAYAIGETIITAEYAGKSITVPVNVEVPKRLDVDREYVFLKVGETEQIKLTAIYGNETKDDTIANNAEWFSDNESVASVSKGKIKANKSGKAVVTAKYGGKTINVSVDVDIPRMITANPASVAMKIGDIQQVNVKTLNFDGREEDITQQAEWTSDSPNIAEVRNGLITGVSQGSTTITAKYGTRSVTIPVSVGVIKNLTVDPKKLVMDKNSSEKVNVTAVYTDGTDKDVTSLATWTVTDPSVAEVDAGLVRAKNFGQTTIKVSFGNQNVTINLEVGMAQTLTVDPKILILDEKETKQITLFATDSDGKSKNVTNDAEWKSSAPLIADVFAGTVTTYSKSGKATITAKYGGKTVTIPVEVGVIEKLELSENFLTMKSGDKKQMKLIATLSNGTTKDLTNEAEWKSSSYKIVDVSNGQVTAVGYGKTRITATVNGKRISIPIEVDQLKYLKTNVVQLELKKGESRQVTATATYNDNTDKNVSILGLWSSSKITVADVKDGIIKATGIGKATITVKYAGKTAKINIVVK